MEITIDEIKITQDSTFFTLVNTKNDAFFSIFKETELIVFLDSYGNFMQSGAITVSINNIHTIEFTQIGESVRNKMGTVIACLSAYDVQELAEKTFYEAGQTRIYDFINQKFTVDF